VHSAAAKAVKVDAGTKRSVHAVCSAGTRDQLPNLLQVYLQGGLNLAVFDVARSGRPKQYDTDAEARVTALACSQPPQGRQRWTILQLEEAARQEAGLGTVSRETVRRMLKKTNSSPGAA